MLAVLFLGATFLLIVISMIAESLYHFSPTETTHFLEEEHIDTKERNAIIEKISANLEPAKLSFSTLWVLTGVVFYIASLLAMERLAFFREAHEHIVVAAAFVLTALCVFILSEGIGSFLGKEYSEKVLLSTYSLIILVAFVMTPLTRLTGRLRFLIERILGTPKKDAEEEGEEEIIQMVSDKEKEGLIEEDAKEMIESIIKMDDVDVADVMTPRTEMILIPSNTAMTEVLETASEHGHSRLPVYEGTPDNVIGVFYVRDLLDPLRTKNISELSLTNVMRAPYFVPEYKNVSELLRDFKKKKLHMAVVLDEYGGTAGVITVEDILEEIVGEIQDEYDEEEEDISVKPIDEHTIEADARIHIRKINEALSLELPEQGDFESLGGFITDKIERIPQKGENFTFDGIKVYILDADNRRVKLVKVERLPGEVDH